MSGNAGPTVAFFRPDDDRAARAADLVTELGARPVSDPLLEVEPSGAMPRTDADYLILTSKAGVELISTDRLTAHELTVCAIGEATASALETRGIEVDVVPAEFTSTGLVDRLADEVAGARVEIARSDHGSATLIDGLIDAGAYVHETVLYRLQRPPSSGGSVERIADGEIDAVLFTSSLTVEHLAAAADERGIELVDALDSVTVGVIGPPTAETAEANGIGVDVIASEASFDTLAREVIAEIA